MPFDEKILELKLKEVAKYYITAKRHLLYSENYFNKISIGVLNEFRNSYDHLMNAIVKSDEKEFDKSISHLRRAAYDACEIISIDASKSIYNKISKYETSVITTILPDYYNEIYPRLVHIQREISKEREKNDELFKDDKHLKEYTKLYDELIEIDEKVAKAVVGMEEYKKQTSAEKSKERRRNLITNIIVGVIASLITASILYFTPINKKETPKETQSKHIDK